jgi:putative transposase
MPRYLRARYGNTYFFTLVTFNRQPILCLDASRRLLREGIGQVREIHPFEVVAWVLLPDHMHALWRLPEGDTDYSRRWGRIKSAFTKGAKAWLQTPAASDSRRKHREGTVWQRRFWEHTIRDDHDFAVHCDYIHYNPVKHGLVAAPGDWPFSTFHRAVSQGLCPADWGSRPGKQWELGPHYE